MRRKQIFYIAGSIIIIACIIVSLLLYQQKGETPLADLNVDSIRTIEISAYPPDEIKVINNREEIQQIAQAMQHIVTYEQVESNDYTGQTVVYTILMTDGTKQEIEISNPLVRIEGHYYKTRYEPAEELNHIYQMMD